MKRMLGWCLLMGVFGSPLAASDLGETTAWTKPQQEVARLIAAWAEAIRVGDVERELSLWTPQVSAWNFRQAAPMDRDAYRQARLDSAREHTVTEMALNPISIQLDRRNAVVHGRYAQTVQDAAGCAKSYTGAWTASLMREGNTWKVFALSSCEDPPAIDPVAIREQVKERMSAYKAACESKDPEARLAFIAESPEFRFVNCDGRAYDAAGFQALVREGGRVLTRVEITTAQTETFPLGTDLALVVWNGAVDYSVADGQMLHAEPYGTTFLWKRSEDTWKLAAEIESALPPKHVAAAGAPCIAPGDLAAAITKAHQAHDTAAIVQLYAEDMVSFLPTTPEPVRGRAAKEKMLLEVFRAYPDLVMDAPLTVVAGDSIVFSGTMNATNTGPLPSRDGEIPATGRHVSLPVTFVWRLGADGLVATEHVYFDAANYRHQLFDAGG